MSSGGAGRPFGSNTGGLSGGGPYPSGAGRIPSGSGTGSLPGGRPSPGRTGGTAESMNPGMQAAAQIIPACTGLLNSMGNLFDSGKKDRERDQRLRAAEKQRHEEEMRKLDEEIERANQSRNQQNAYRQEAYNRANSDIQRRQEEKLKREQELAKQKEKERKRNEEQLQREREMYDQRIRAAEERSQQLMADTRTSMEDDHQNFLVTKQHMENTHKMEQNMVKGLAGATALLYKDLGYFDGVPQNNGNPGVNLKELEAAPSSQQMDNIQPGQFMNEQRPMEAPSVQQAPDCHKCGSQTKMTYCSHFFCPNCHVNEEKIHCPVCQKIFS